MDTEKEYILTKQLSRSATSVGANVREARNAVSKADFANKLCIAQKECDESIYWIELLIAFIETENDQLKKQLDEAKPVITDYQHNYPENESQQPMVEKITALFNYPFSIFN